jgi:hypothetical protein
MSEKPVSRGCQCRPCIEQRSRVEKRERGSLLNPKLSKKLSSCCDHVKRLLTKLVSRSVFIIAGWSLFVYVSYKVAGAKLESKIYDPFEILGLRAVSPQFSYLDPSTTCVLLEHQYECSVFTSLSLASVYRSWHNCVTYSWSDVFVCRVYQRKKSSHISRSFHACSMYLPSPF